MSRVITVTAKDGDNEYTFARDADANTATLALKGKLTPKLAKDLVEDLTPLAGVKKRKAQPVESGTGALALKLKKPDADPG